MKTRRNHIVWMRLAAALLVVTGHGLLSTISRYGNDQILTGITDFIYYFHIPLFMCISGYLFYYSEVQLKNCSTPFIAFCKKRFIRLLVPYVIVMFFYTKPIKYLAGVYQTINLSFFLRTHHLWYLYVLFILSVVAKLMIGWIRKRRLNVVLVGGLCIILNLLSAFFDGPVHHVLYYGYYFMLGTLLCTAENKDIRIWKATIACSVIWGTTHIVMCSTGAISPLLAAIEKTEAGTSLVLLIFSCLLPFKNKAIPKWIDVLSGYSMGIYLFHEPIMDLYAHFVHNDMIDRIPYLITIIFSSLIVSIGITALLRKMKLHFVLGEYRPSTSSKPISSEAVTPVSASSVERRNE